MTAYRSHKLMQTGFRSGYWVIEWADDFDPNLVDLVPHFPEIVLGHRIAISSCDSGPYEPTLAEFAKGWTRQEEVAVSPGVNAPSDLPMPGFDEWYVYAVEAPCEHHNSFVNQWGFSPLDEMNPETHNFWTQVERFRPLHVLGAGTSTMFLVTRDEALFSKISGVSHTALGASAIGSR
jgi:hypothetical protein